LRAGLVARTPAEAVGVAGVSVGIGVGIGIGIGAIVVGRAESQDHGGRLAADAGQQGGRGAM
jgi:uncharacterized protein (UPF0254 family)